jgi:hypothetical protein
MVRVFILCKMFFLFPEVLFDRASSISTQITTQNIAKLNSKQHTVCKIWQRVDLNGRARPLQQRRSKTRARPDPRAAGGDGRRRARAPPLHHRRRGPVHPALRARPPPSHRSPPPPLRPPPRLSPLLCRLPPRGPR